MRNKRFLGVGLVIIVAICIYAHFFGVSHSGSKSDSTSATEYERGSHRGRMLREDSFALELTIFEDNVPPEYHVYAYKDNKPLDPSKVQLSITLNRLDGEVNTFKFTPENDYLKGDKVIAEPHSFEVKVQATYNDKTYAWAFPSHEGRTKIDSKVAAASGIKIDKVGPAVIKETISVTGRIVLNHDATADVKARFPGVVRSIEKKQGDIVKAGDVLATVESNDSLQTYSLKAPIDGTIISRDANLGDTVNDAPLFILADLSAVWAEFQVFPQDITRFKIGQKVQVTNNKNTGQGEGSIMALLPLMEPTTQTIMARALLDNSKKEWYPGMTVRGTVVVDTREVKMAVKSSGLQTFRDFNVVFAQVGETYEVRMLELGLKDDEYVEVLGGIKLNTDYVSENSFLIKADIEKSAASHDH